jgi:hypothetical protein
MSEESKKSKPIEKIKICTLMGICPHCEKPYRIRKRMDLYTDELDGLKKVPMKVHEECDEVILRIDGNGSVRNTFKIK